MKPGRFGVASMSPNVTSWNNVREKAAIPLQNKLISAVIGFISQILLSLGKPYALLVFGLLSEDTESRSRQSWLNWTRRMSLPCTGRRKTELQTETSINIMRHKAWDALGAARFNDRQLIILRGSRNSSKLWGTFAGDGDVDQSVRGSYSKGRRLCQILGACEG
ncbi:hypothetical protein SISSUDRAFT_33270 [Sistotremastrum suecicum HHB10207 ss-3]|uniref:Uncharacterized protein n=1 Tax=Sistotremastrum suecicum HHB10207 ss-3 TaxID=1314776 RepID=A0A166JCY0_9AGAM|nr:hypothetical protein SISSUDRAFT_33270 [Sistotremastrum suecicum HHB10207 ss-3]